MSLIKPQPMLRSSPIAWGMLFFIAVTAVLYSLVLNPVFPFQGGDSANYYFLAQALLNGAGYVDTYFEPATPHTKYPFVFPVLLAGIFSVAGDDIRIAKSVVVAFLPIAAFAVWRIGAIRNQSMVGMCAALFLVVNNAIYLFSIHLLSEIPFIAFSLTTLMLIERHLNQDVFPRRLGYLWMGAACLLLAFFTRTIGFVLLPAILITFFLHRRRNTRADSSQIWEYAIVLIPFFFAIGAWSLRTYMLQDSVSTYLQQFESLSSLRNGFSAWGNELLARGHHYLADIGAMFMPWITRENQLGAGSIVAALTFIGIYKSGKNQFGTIEIYLLIYLTVVLMWPYEESRFLLPALPLIGYFTFAGILAIVESASRLRGLRVNPSHRRRIGLLLILGLSAAHAIQDIADGLLFEQDVAKADRLRTSYAINSDFVLMAGSSAMWRMMQLAIAARERHDPGRDVIMARKPTLISLASGHPTAPMIDWSDPGVSVQKLDSGKIGFVLMDEVYSGYRIAFDKVVQTHPSRFELIWQLGDSRMYRVVPGR